MIVDSDEEKEVQEPADPAQDETQLYHLNTQVFEESLQVTKRVRQKSSPAKLATGPALPSPGHPEESTRAREVVQTPSPKGVCFEHLTPPKTFLTRDDQLNIKHANQAEKDEKKKGKGGREEDGGSNAWTKQEEMEMWKEWDLFVQQRTKERADAAEREWEMYGNELGSKRKLEDGELPKGKKGPRREDENGRPIIFARRYCPSKDCWGKTLWECLVDAFRSIVVPTLQPGAQTKVEVSPLHLVACMFHSHVYQVAAILSKLACAFARMHTGSSARTFVGPPVRTSSHRCPKRLPDIL